MSITTTWKCDRCGHEQGNATQMWEIGVSIQHAADKALRREWKWLPTTTPLWCRQCCDAVGLIGEWKPPAGAPQTPAPTLEDQLREIIREEIDEARKNQ